MLHLTYQDETHQFDMDTLLVPESDQVYDFTGLNPFQWRDALTVWNGKAVWALWALARARGGNPVKDWDAECATFNILGLTIHNDALHDSEDADLPTQPGAAG